MPGMTGSTAREYYLRVSSNILVRASKRIGFDPVEGTCYNFAAGCDITEKTKMENNLWPVIARTILTARR